MPDEKSDIYPEPDGQVHPSEFIDGNPISIEGLKTPRVCTCVDYSAVSTKGVITCIHCGGVPRENIMK